MEKNKGSNNSLLNKILLASALGLGVAGMAINHGAKTKEIKEVTSTFQGYNIDEGRYLLVFDDKIKAEREDFPDLVIEGEPDTLKIGKGYTIKYSTKNWSNIFPDKLREIKYAGHSD